MRLEIGAARRRIALEPMRRGRRGLHLGQAVDLVVVQHHGHVHVVAHGMNPVGGADAAAVAVAGIDEDVEVGPRQLDALGDRQRPAVDAVETVGLHVVREAARAADAGHEHGLLRPQILVAAQPLHRGEDRVVAAAGAPARHAALVVLELVMLVVQSAAGIRWPQWSWVSALNLVAACSRMTRVDRAGLDRLAPHLAPAVDVDQVARPQQHRQRRVAPVVLVDDPILRAGRTNCPRSS